VTNNVVRSVYCNNPPGGHNLCAKKITDAIVDVVVESVLDVALESSVLGVLFDLELGVLMLSCLLSIFRTLSRHIFSVRP
jgi:hypothetical protein